jgi:hypothetical protein
MESFVVISTMWGVKPATGNGFFQKLKRVADVVGLAA